MFSRLKPNDTLELFGNTWIVEPNPFKKDIPFLQEGRKAWICKLRNNQGDFSALKIFKKRFQDSAMEAICAGIRQFSSIPGMSACERRVITPVNHPQILVKYPDFSYSVLMPWVSGILWCEVLLQSLPKKTPILSQDQSLILATSLTQTLKELEDRRIAHTDVSSGNVIIDLKNSQVSLIDVEDMYAPTLHRPSVITTGTTGYQHSESINGLWREEADRFAGVVLIIEILALSKINMLPLIYGESFFDLNEIQNPLSARYIKVTEMLKKYHSSLVPLWEQAWVSTSLAHCPKFSEWFLSLQQKTPIQIVGNQYLQKTPSQPIVKNQSFMPVVTWTKPIKIPVGTLQLLNREMTTEPQPTKISFLPLERPNTSPILAKPEELKNSTPAESYKCVRYDFYPIEGIDRVSFYRDTFFEESDIEKVTMMLGAFLGMFIGLFCDHKMNTWLFLPFGVIAGCCLGFFIGRICSLRCR